jgi:hypothetical protein
MPQNYSPNSLQAVQIAQLNVNDNIKIAQEPVGALECVNLKFDDKRVSKNEVVLVPIDPLGALEDVQPGAVPPQGASATVTNAKITVTALRQKSRVLTGEDIRQFENQDAKNEILRQFIGNAQRLLRNEMAAAAGQAMAVSASRATGTAGTTPFAKDLSALVTARKTLRDNGCPYIDVNFVTNTAAYANMLNLGVIEQAQQAGSDIERRTAVIRAQFGTMKLVEDIFLPQHSVVGSGAAYVLNGAAVKGQTAIPFNGGGATDTILYGDVITIANDSTKSKYIVVPGPGTDTTFPNPVNAGSFVTNAPYTIQSIGTTNFVAIGAASNTVGVTFVATGAGSGTGTATQAGLVGASGTLYIGNPGLQASITTGSAITIGAAYTPSYMLEKSSVVGIIRPPIGFDTGGYVAASYPITDAFNYTYNFIESYQWGCWSWYVQLAWGFAGIQSEYGSVVLG